jgi:hypothetical protein
MLWTKRGPVRLAGMAFFCLLSGCASSTSTKVSTPPPPPPSNYIPLSQTAFFGDEIVLSWSGMNTGGATLGVFGISNGTTQQITQYLGTEDECVSGCTPDIFQSMAGGGMKRAVFLMGTYDVVESEPCEGGPAAAWDGKTGDAGDPIAAYGEMLQAAQNFYPGVSLVVGTIPPLGANLNSGCATVVSTLNTEIKTMAVADGVLVADFNASLSASDISTTEPYEGIVPNASGYTVMTQVYSSVNQ